MSNGKGLDTRRFICGHWRLKPVRKRVAAGHLVAKRIRKSLIFNIKVELSTARNLFNLLKFLLNSQVMLRCRASRHTQSHSSWSVDSAILCCLDT
jgi:hypothetical protein